MLRLILVSRRNLTSSQLHGLDVWELDVKVTAKEDITFNRRHTPLDGPFGCIQTVTIRQISRTVWPESSECAVYWVCMCVDV